MAKKETSRVAVVGGGPAGLRAAELLSAAGQSVTLFEGMRSVGRKFLVAGKGGFNITHSEEMSRFQTRYSGPGMDHEVWNGILADFDNTALRAWAAELGTETFVASSGRVYPEALKAAPLLRAWILRLKARGVEFCVRHKLVGLERVSSGYRLSLETSEGMVRSEVDAVVLALGGASWPQTGSDGKWVEWMREAGIGISELRSANCGWNVEWPASFPLDDSEGKPVKNLVVRAGEEEIRGELLLTRYGIQGGAIYALGKTLREMPVPMIEIDFKPMFEPERLALKMQSVKRDFLQQARGRLKLSAEAIALIEAFGGDLESVEAVVAAVKSLRIPLVAPRPIDEVISSAGGVRWDLLDRNLMITERPGLFVAGEMIDWEAPTGGYLMQGCFASGTRAAKGCLEFLERRDV